MLITAQNTELYYLNSINVEILVAPSPSFGIYPRVPNTSGKPLYTNSHANNDQLPMLASDIYLPAGDSINTYFGGDSPDIAGFGHASSPVFLDKVIKKSDFPIKLEGYFFNRSIQASYNESYFWIGNYSHENYNPTNTTLPNADFQEGLIMGGRPDLQLINNSKGPTEPSERLFDKTNSTQLYNRWFKMSVIVDINENNQLVINKFMVDDVQILSSPLVVEDMNYFNLEELMVAMSIDDFGKDFSITYNFRIENNIEIEACNQYIWENDTLTLSGNYTKSFVTSFGCDSIVNLALTILPNLEKSLNLSICEGDTIEINNVLYNAAGQYSQNLVGVNGCDTTLQINIHINPPTEGTLDYKLCDGESVIVNDDVYGEAGTFQQLLENVNGCDSILTIHILKGVSTSSKVLFSLCNQSSVVVNGTTYNAAGEFEQILENETGCDSTLFITILPCTQNVTYDFQQCNAITPEQSMTYQEFKPTYRSVLSCGSVEMTNVYRENPQENKHSCTLGQSSTLAMCISASQSCQFDQADQNPIVFGFKAQPESGSSIRFNHIEFYHLSPLQFNWIQGPSGPNNYPTRFAVQVYKNDVLLYNQTGLSTSSQWTKSKHDFFEDEQYILQSGDSIRIEITPYCVTPNGGNMSVWDIDNIALFFSCKDVNNRVAGGQITKLGENSIKAIIERKAGDRILQVETAESAFVFPKNDPFTQYEFTGFSDQNPTLGVSTFDLVLIQRHILNITPFDNPLQFIAADINNDGKINTIDLVELRKIILGIKEDFPNNKSWKLVPQSNINNTGHPLFWENSILLEPGYHDVMNMDFIPVKIGDIDGLK